jgi:hypothetical protein
MKKIYAKHEVDKWVIELQVTMAHPNTSINTPFEHDNILQLVTCLRKKSRKNDKEALHGSHTMVTTLPDN